MGADMAKLRAQVAAAAEVAPPTAAQGGGGAAAALSPSGGGGGAEAAEAAPAAAAPRMLRAMSSDTVIKGELSQKGSFGRWPSFFFELAADGGNISLSSFKNEGGKM